MRALLGVRAVTTFTQLGNKVYWAPNVLGSASSTSAATGHVLAAIDDTGKLPDTGLGYVAASGPDLSGRR